MKLIDALVTAQPRHAEWRRHIHAHPELAYQEHRTAEFVGARLLEFGVPYVDGIGKTGIVGTVKKGSGRRAIGLRADMDALPLQEMNEFDHRSCNDGVMHACGHDGHTTMLLAAAEQLVDLDFDGTVYLIFQPAEEGEAGAKAMMDDGLFERFPMEAVYGLHNWPGLEVGKMAMREGTAMAAMDVFELTVTGKGGHAALPHLTVDPIVTACEIVQSWQSIVSRNLKPIEAAVVSVTQIHAGDAWAVTPETVVLRGTVRCFNEEVRELIERRMQSIAAGVCEGKGCELVWWYDRRFPPTVNSATETEYAADAARALLGADNVNAEVEPVTGSEDFGYMLEAKPGYYAFIGNGPGAGGCLLHSPHFDFNDDAIPIGASYWITLVQNLLGKGPDPA